MRTAQLVLIQTDARGRSFCRFYNVSFKTKDSSLDFSSRKVYLSVGSPPDNEAEVAPYVYLS